MTGDLRREQAAQCVELSCVRAGIRHWRVLAKLVPFSQAPGSGEAQRMTDHDRMDARGCLSTSACKCAVVAER